MWPFNRRRAEESSRESAPAPYAPARAEWRQLPPLQRMVGDQWLVNPPDSLSSRLASWQDPTYLAPLGHAVLPEGPSGAIEPAPAAPPEPKRIDLQRKAVRTDPPAPVRSLQRTASDRGQSEQHPSLGDTGPMALQRIDPDQPLASPDPAPAAEAEDRPLLGDSLPQVDPPEPDPAVPTEAATVSDLPVRSEPHASSSPLGPMPSVQRLPDPVPRRPFDQSLEVASAPAAPIPVQPVTPFALQRLLVGDRPPIASQAPLPQPPAPAQPVFASLLASTDPPERRELPVVAAPRPAAPLVGEHSAPAVQRSIGETAPLLGEMDLSPAEPASSPPLAPEGLAGTLVPGPAAPDTSAPFAEPEGETAPLLGATGLAAPIVQTIRDEAPPAESHAPMPIAPLIADRPRPQPAAETHVQRLGLGSPMSGPQPSVQRAGGRSDRLLPPVGTPSGVRLPMPQFVQRLEGASSSPEVPGPMSPPADSPSPGRGLPVSVPAEFGVPVPQAAPSPSSAPARQLPPPVMVMRSASPSEAMPVVSRSIEAPEALYAPDPGPEAPLLGSRPLAAAFTESEPAAGAPPEPRASEPGSGVAQRSTWSHMRSPVPQADLAPAPVPFGGAPLSGPAAPGTVAAVQRVAQSSSVVQQRLDAPVVQRFNMGEPLPVAAAPAPVQAMAEPAPPQFVEPVQDVVQRVAAPPEPVSVQTVDAAPATATAAPATAGAAPAADPAALLAVLYEPLVRRLRADLRVDRERRGRLTDL